MERAVDLSFIAVLRLIAQQIENWNEDRTDDRGVSLAVLCYDASRRIARP